MNASCINLYNELEKRLNELTFDDLNYLFKDTIVNNKYKWDCHYRQFDIYSYYIYTFCHNKHQPVIWYPYSKETAVHIIFYQSSQFSLIGEKDIISNNNFKSFLEYFQIKDNTTWEERIEYILYRLI